MLDFTEVFEFRITDIDPMANDISEVEISCFLVQNLGTANETQITDVMIIDEADVPVFNSPVTTAAPSDVVDPDCPLGAPAVSSVTFEAFIKGGSLVIDDDDSAIFRVAVRTAPTGGIGGLLNGAQGKTVRLRVTIRFAESVGSPAEYTLFEASLTDSTPDTVFNGGINDLIPLSFSPFPISPDEEGVVSRFRICDQDANTYELRLEELTLVQGPLGSAVIHDFTSFALYMVSGPEEKWGEVTNSDPVQSWSAQFNRGGVGIPLDVDPGFTIPDDACLDFEIRAAVAPGAMVGRNVHLHLTFTVREPPYASPPIDPSVAPTMQTSETVMLGSGVVRIPDVQIAGSLVPIEVVDLSPPGLGRLEVQTGAVQFDPSVIHVEAVEPVSPYQVEEVQIDNRLGLLHFTLFLPPGQTAKTGLPEPDPVAYLKLSRQGRPGQRSPLIFQVDRIEDADGNEITEEVMVVSGNVTLLSLGDVDFDGMPTVRDALILATALLGCLDDPPRITGLTDEEKKIADVAKPFAPAGETPDCTTLTSADVAGIVRLAIGLTGLSSSMPQGSSPTLRVRALKLTHRWEGWQLNVEGQGISSVILEVFDSAGRRRLASEAFGPTLHWRMRDSEGRQLANGVYLYVVTVRGINGEAWRSGVRKLAMLR